LINTKKLFCFRKKGSDLELKNTITSSDASFFGNKDHEKVEEGKEESLVQKLRTTKKKKKKKKKNVNKMILIIFLKKTKQKKSKKTVKIVHKAHLIGKL